jgi:hypothetical protein
METGMKKQIFMQEAQAFSFVKIESAVHEAIRRRWKVSQILRRLIHRCLYLGNNAVCKSVFDENADFLLLPRF